MCGRRRSPTSSGRRAWRPAPARTWTCTTRRTKKAVLASRDAGAALRAPRSKGSEAGRHPLHHAAQKTRWCRKQACGSGSAACTSSQRQSPGAASLHAFPASSSCRLKLRQGGAMGRGTRRPGHRPLAVAAALGLAARGAGGSFFVEQGTVKVRPPPHPPPAPSPAPFRPAAVEGGRWRGASRWPAPAGGGPCVTWHRQVAAARVRPSLPGVSVPRRPQPDEPLRRPSPSARAGGRPGPRLGAPAGPGLTPCGRRRRGPPRSRGSTRWTVSAGETGGSGRPPPTSSPSPPTPASPAAAG